MSQYRGNQHRYRHGKRKQDDRRQYDAAEEEAVDDLLIASMAVASTWSLAPAARTSDSDSESDGPSDDGDSDSSDDSERNVDADEISITSDHDEAIAQIKEEFVDADQVGVMGEEIIGIDTGDPTNPRIKVEDESEDDVSDIDLTENLANMEDDDEESPVIVRENNSSGFYRGPKTEHELDPYKCPTDQLEKLNVYVGTDSKQEGEFSILDESTRNRLRVAGTMRSYLVEQRTIVVDSLIPTALQSHCQNHNTMNTPLDEGSMLAVLLAKGNDETTEVTTLKKHVACTVQVLGQIIEVFGPVQRPLYVIRLPDPPNVVKSSEKYETKRKVAAEQKSPADDTAVKTEEDVKATNNTNPEKTVTVVKEKTPSEAAQMAQDEEDSVSNAINAKQTATNNQSTDDTSEKRKDTDLAEEDDDPWSLGGKLSTVLRRTSNAVVYSLVDHLKLINKDHIIKVSGRGCDASNVYDEEAGPNEQDFSDDEAEREAKKGNRKPRQSDQSDVERRESGGRGAARGARGRGRGRGRMHGNYSCNPQNMHQQPLYNAQQSGPVQHQYYNPQGYQHPRQAFPQQGYGQFHPGSQQTQYYQQPYQMQPANYGGWYPAYGHGAPPPPPPPRQNNTFGHDSQQQQQNGNAAPQSQTPSSEGDTVYYDYTAGS